MHLQRTIGNRAIGAMLESGQRARPPAPPSVQKEEPPAATESSKPAKAARQVSLSSSSPVIQRKVYIKKAIIGGYRNKNKTGRGAEGEGERNVANMIADDKSRYFTSKAEMSSYAAGSTEKIGYVNRTRSWVRLPGQMLVLGEDHTQTTLQDVVNAVGTDKYKHEAFTESPVESETNPALAESFAQREDEIKGRYNVDETEGRDHRGESFYPKIIRALQGVELDASNYRIYASDAILAYLIMAVQFAASAEPGSDLYQWYLPRQALWEQTAVDLKEHKRGEVALSREMRAAGSSELFTQFVSEVTKYAEEKIREEQEAAPLKDRQAFAGQWHLAEDRDYSSDAESPIMKAENARDFSMYQHIKKAKSDGYLLFGLGELHRKRLGDLLSQEGIMHKNIDTFIQEQDTAHPQ